MHLLFITARFPFLPGEEFIEDELPILANAFDHITIVPVFPPIQGGRRPVPDNVSVRDDLTREMCRRRSAMHRSAQANVQRLLRIFSPSLLREWFRCLPFWTPFHLLRFQEQATLLAHTIADALPLPTIDIVYSYWLMQGALTAALLKEHSPQLTTVSRAHGFDLYPSRMHVWHLPFRELIFSTLDRVCASSQIGTRFLSTQYPWASHRIETRYLGVQDQELPAKPSSDGVLRIVSCSRIIPLKRVHLIADALRHVERKVEWTHIGGGNGLGALQRKINGLPSHVTARLTGHLPHSDVLRFYRDHPTDVFCAVSRSEGLSVSLLEALSFGIPAITTQVGGQSEAVNDTVGILLPKTVSSHELAHALDRFDARDFRRRAAARARQRTAFSARKNYGDFTVALRSRFRVS